MHALARTYLQPRAHTYTCACEWACGCGLILNRRGPPVCVFSMTIISLIFKVRPFVRQCMPPCSHVVVCA
jgi:hypothetical protein